MGMIIVMQFRSQTGPFCRDCGLATFRDMTASTLIGGWWGYLSLVICPITVLINLVRRGAVAKLPPPMPPPNGQHRGHPRAHPMDPGKPLMTRPAALVGMALPLVPILGFIGIAVLGAVTGG
jgi:hypothetical protein